MPHKIAVLCADLHLSDKPPIARSGEPDWYEAMSRPLRELRDIQSDVEKQPVICGGDVFDRWKSPPKLITFAMQQLPDNFESVMGQHDLPYHSWGERTSSAFWTLVEGNALDCLDGWRSDGKLARRGFQWGEKLEPCERGLKEDESVSLSVAHAFCWWKDRGPESLSSVDFGVNHRMRQLEKFDVMLFGDNHRGFLVELGKSARRRGKRTVFNAGTFMRRTVDEKDYAPMVGVLFDDGTVKRHYLDTSSDILDASEPVAEAEETMVNFAPFLEELSSLSDGPIDFRQAVEHALAVEQVSKSVRRVILESMEQACGD